MAPLRVALPFQIVETVNEQCKSGSAPSTSSLAGRKRSGATAFAADGYRVADDFNNPVRMVYLRGHQRGLEPITCSRGEESLPTGNSTSPAAAD